MLNAIPISSGFSDFFKQHLPWHKAEMDYLAGILTAMHVRPTLNLVGHKDTLPSKAKSAFPCRRMQRFVTHEWLVYLRFYRALIWPSEKQSVQSGRRAYGGACEDDPADDRGSKYPAQCPDITAGGPVFMSHRDWTLCESFSALLTRHTFQTATKTATISAPRRFP